MNITVSETIEKQILMSYPHLTKEEVRALFVEGKLIREPIDVYANERQLVKPIVNELHIPLTLARVLNVDTIIEFATGKDSIIYTIQVE